MSAIAELIEDTAGNIADLVDDTVGNLVDLVEDTVGNVVDLVEDTVGNVVEVIGDAVDWVMDDIINPIVEGIGDTIQYVLDNPIEAIAKGLAYVYAPWAIPLIDGAIVLDNGGDFSDALKAAAISYAGSKVGDFTSTYVSPEIAKAGFNKTVTDIVTQGAKSAATAVVYGQDPLKAFATGGIQAATGAALGFVDTELKKITGQFDAEGKEIVSGWNKLNNSVKDTIETALAAEISGGSAADALNSTFMAGLVDKYTNLGGFMDTFLENNTGLSADKISVLTSAMNNAVTTALSGNPEMSGEAFFARISQYGQKELKALVDKPVDLAIDKVTGVYKKYEASGTALRDTEDKLTALQTEHDGILTTLNGRITEQTNLATALNSAVDTYNANKTPENLAAAEAAKTAYESYSTKLEQDYNNTYKPKLDSLAADHATYTAKIPDLQESYDNTVKYLMSDIDDLSATMTPIYTEANRVVALTLRPGIDEDSYRKLNGLAADEDVYGHYLANSKTAQVFDPADMGAEYSYDASTNKYYLETPDGKQEVDPYVETVRGGRGEDPRLFGDYNMEDIRKTYSQPVEILSRITYDMAQLLATDTMDAKSLQGGVILPEHFKTLKDAGYNIVPYTDPVLKKVVDGTKEYSVMQTEYKDYVKRIGDEDLAMSGTVYDPEYGVMSQPVSYTGKTMTYNGTTPITAETQKILKEFHGYTNEQAAKYYPIGSMVNEVPSPDLVAEFEAAGYSPPDYDVLMSISKSGVGLAGSAENFVQNSIGVTLDSLGQLATTFSYAKLLTNSAGWTEGAIEDTWLNKLGTSMSQIGQDFETDDYRLGVETLNANMSKAMAEAEGIGGTIKAIWGAASSAPGTFITEYIVSEIIQELPALLVSGGASALVSGGFKLAGKEIVESLATRGGIALGVGAVSDLAESYGGAAQSAYDEAYSTYMSVQTNALLGQGFSKEEATQKTSGAAKKYATDLAVAAGNVGALMGMVSMGVGGLALEKAIFGTKKAPEGFAASMEALYKKSGLNEFIDLGGVVLKEGFSEALEELVTNDFIEGRLSLIDQDRPRTESNTAAALLGFMAGGTTAGAIYTGSKVAGIIESTGNSVANVQLLSNPDVTKLITNPPVSTSNATSSELLTSALKTYGIDNVDTIDSLTNTALGTAYTSKQEVKDAIKLANPTITFSDSFIADATKALGGEKSDSEIDRIIESYINPRYITREEVKKAAAEEGITLTDEQAGEYEGEGDQDTVLDEVIADADPLATTQEEARQFFNDLGFTPTDEQVAQFVGAKTEEEQKAAIAKFVDPLQTTEAEARKFFTDQGYEPTDEEVAARVGQIAESKTKEDIDTYVDPRQVTAAEVTDAYAELGLERPTDADIQALIGQYMETDLAGKAEKNLPTARYNSIINILDNFTGEVGVSEEMQEALNLVKKDMITALGDLGLEVAAIDKAVTEVKDAVDALPVGASPEDVSTAITTALEGLENISAEDVSTAITNALADMNNLSTDDVQGIIDTALEGLNNLSTDDVQGIIDTALAGLPETASPEDVSTAITTALEGLENISAEDVSTAITNALADMNNLSTDDVSGIVDDAIGELNNLSTDDVQGIIDTALAGLPETASPEDVSTAITTALEGLENISAEDVNTAITNALADMNNLSTDDVSGIVDDAIGAVEKTITDLETDLTKLIEDNDGDVDTALAELAADLGTTEEALLKELGTTKDALSKEFTEGLSAVGDILGTPGVADDPSTAADETQDATGLFATIAAYEAGGLSRDEALQKAIEDVSGALGTTKTDLLASIGETETSLLGAIGETETSLLGAIGETETRLTTEIGDSKTELLTLIGENEAAGMTRDEATQAAIGELAAAFDVGRTELLTAIGETEASLAGQLGDVAANLGADIQTVADLIGKPAREVTQADIDFVIDLIAQENVSAELIAQYDVTGDGIVDINDQTMLETALQGGDVTLAATSMFDPATGLYLQQEQDTQALLDEQARIAEELRIQQELDTQTVLDQNTELNTQLNTQINTNAQQKSLRDFLDAGQMGAFEGGGYSATTPDPVGEITPYDWQTIFRDQEQAGRYASPYASYGTTRANPTNPANLSTRPLPSAAGFAAGGQVEDINAMLLKLLGDT
jgi:hypothetical protein